MRNRKILGMLVLALFLLFLTGCSPDSKLAAPGVTLSIDGEDQPKEVATGVQLLVLLTVLSMAPSILILGTSFTRIVIVLSMLRSAIGTPSIPPNQVVIGLAMLMTFFIMAPVYTEIDQRAIQPFLEEKIDQEAALQEAIKPIRTFMLKQTREKDLALFLDLGQLERPKVMDDISIITIFPAFVISELRTAFIMGFVIFIPFLIIDLVVASILLSMGMMMLPPSLVSLPFKLLLFVMVDGWFLLTRSLVLSFTGS